MHTLFGSLFGRSPAQAQADAVIERLYGEIVRRTRQPVLYEGLGVPDTLDARYDVLLLHAFPVFRRLGTLSRAQAEAVGVSERQTEASGLSQALFDHMVRDLDTNLREAGVSDMRIGARMKKLARGFYGRLATYDEALAQDDGDAALRDALDRNVFNKVLASDEGLAALAGYVRAMESAAALWSWEDLSQGRVTYPDPPTGMTAPAPESTAEQPA